MRLSSSNTYKGIVGLGDLSYYKMLLMSVPYNQNDRMIGVI